MENDLDSTQATIIVNPKIQTILIDDDFKIPQ